MTTFSSLIVAFDLILCIPFLLIMKLFSRRNRNTMAYTARLFMLLAIAVPILALPVFGSVKLPILARTDALPEEYPADPEREDTRPNLEKWNTYLMDDCPPFGHPDNSFNVTVLGTTAPKIGGCASMVPLKPDWIPSFNLWLGSPKTGGGKCGDKNMDHYIFDCLQRYPFITEELTLEAWLTYLYSKTWAPDKLRWSAYEIVSEDPPMFKMVINGINSKWGLKKRMEQSEQAVPEGFRQSADGSIALLFSRDFPVLPMWSPSKRMEQSEQAVPEGFRHIADGSISLVFEKFPKRPWIGPIPYE